MKNPLQNLLIVLALCLCALCTYQWHVEKNLRQDIQHLTDTNQDKLEALQNQQSALKRADEEIKRLDGLKTDLTETVKSNRTEIAKMMKDLEKSDLEVERGLKQMEVYKGALQQANDAIKSQNESIKKQNEDVKKLSTEHGELAAKYNKVVAEFNDLAKKWNEAQAAAAAAATNAPAKK